MEGRLEHIVVAMGEMIALVIFSDEWNSSLGDSLGPQVQPEKLFLDVSRTCWHRFFFKSHWNHLIITLLWLVHIAILVKFWDVHLFLGPGLLLIPAVAEHWGVPVACVMCDVWWLGSLWLISDELWYHLMTGYLCTANTCCCLLACFFCQFVLWLCSVCFPFFFHVYFFVSISHVSIWICIIS